MGVGCKRVKYQFSPPTSRALPLDKESSNHFLVLPKGVKEVLSTNQPTNQPTIFHILNRVLYIPAGAHNFGTPEPLNLHTHRVVIQPYRGALKAVRHSASEG